MTNETAAAVLERCRDAFLLQWPERTPFSTRLDSGLEVVGVWWWEGRDEAGAQTRYLCAPVNLMDVDPETLVTHLIMNERLYGAAVSVEELGIETNV